ncbi:MAG: GNAT family N-acetyltransferase [Candidatus Nanoarchaeia archaeon]|jgi:RimJ/RimL family protein N-acetyltransferase
MIRRYVKSDFEGLEVLIKKYNNEVSESPVINDFYNANNLSTDFDCFVLVENSKVYGFITGQKIKNDYLLLDVYVDKNKRNQGYAIKLIKKLLDNAKKYKRILSNPENYKSIALLKKLGFKELSENKKNTSKTGIPPYFTHYYLN